MKRKSMPMINESLEIENLNNINNNETNKNQNNKNLVLNDKIFMKELIYFKNDILKEIKELDCRIIIQNHINNDVNKKLILYNQKLEDLTQKLEDFTNIINHKDGQSSYYNDKLNSLFEFKSKIEQDSITLNYKLNLTAEELKDAINKYDKLIYNNIIYPGVIGFDTKFKNYHEFIDYVLQQIQNLTVFKDKNIIDLKTYKKKIESNVKELGFQMQSLLNTANTYALKNIKLTEERFLDEIKDNNAKIIELKVEHCNFITEMEKKNKELLNEYKKVTDIKQDLKDFIKTTVETKLKKLSYNYNNDQILSHDHHELIKDNNENNKNNIFLTNSFYEKKEMNSYMNNSQYSVNRIIDVNTKNDINNKTNDINNKTNDINEIKHYINLNEDNEDNNKIEKNNQELISKKEVKASTSNKNKKARKIKSAESTSQYRVITLKK